MRLVFMGTPAFALPALKSLHEAGHDIAAVYTQPPRPAGRGQKETPSPTHVYAQAHGIPVYTPTTLKTSEAQAEFAAHKADVAIVVAYGLLLPKPILDACPLGCINVHPSLLPRWRGAAPIQRTIMAGDRETAIVIMQMDEGLDTGDMLLTERYPILPGTTSGVLHDELAGRAGPLLLKTLEGLAARTITPTPQPDTGVAYAKKITKEECKIDWNQPAEAIYHHILGLNPAPGANFSYGGEIIKIYDATFDTQPSKAPAGMVVNDQLGIACNPGTLHPALIQRPGKKRLPAGEVLHSYSIPVGTRLGS